MAKMFYSVEEAAQVLGKSTDDVIEMAKSGQIQEFKDRERLMFKKEQIDLLAGHSENEETGGLGESDMGGVIGLADSNEADALMESKEESVLGLEDSKEQTGISIFDADELETADPSEATQISDTVEPMEFSLDNAGSGSGLLDLTKEVDDTSLGADLSALDEDIYQSGEDSGEASGIGAEAESGFFDTGGDEAEEAGAATGPGMVLPAVVEAYDGAWSGAGVGFAIPALAALFLASTILISALSGTLVGLTQTFSENYMMFGGIAAGVTILLGIIGYFIGKSIG